MKPTKLIALILLVLAGLILAAAAQSQAPHDPPCTDRHEAVAQLHTMFGERIIGYGLTASGLIIEIFAASSGSWTIFATTPQGKSCLIASGESWEPRPQPDIFAGR